MADMQRAGMTGTASMRIPLNGTVNVGGKIMKELRFMPYSEFPETGREETLYIDTDGNTLYYYDGAYIALSGGGGGGTGDYNELSNKPQINGNTLNGNKTAANLGLQETISDLTAIRSGAASGSTAVQPATLATALATKQDTISDLASIRSGASKGDTAVQPSDMEEALSEKQDVIDDLNDIRTGAGLGATAVQPADMETALADKQDVISDLDAIRSGATAGYTALQPEDIDTLPTYGSSNPVSSGGTYNFVNSSIATNTAYFIGTFASVAELEAYTGTVTNNDYAFVTSTDSAGNTLYNRYKYNSATQEWSFEYAVNNTAFTAAQWAAIQSGLTASDKTKLDGIETGANKTVIDATPTSGSSNAVSSGGVHTALSGKQDTIADLSDIRSGASAGATAVQPSALTDYQTKLSGTNKLDPSYIEYDATHRAVTDTEKSTWNGKQSALTTEQLAAVNSGIDSVDVAQIETNKNNILLIAQNGVVNILANTAVTTTVARNGLTYTVNADKSVTVTGNASAYYAFTIAGSRTYANAMPLKRGTYIIKAGIAFDSSKPIYVQFGVMTSSEASISLQNIYDTNKELVVNNDTTRIVYELYNPSGSYSGYNATFYPMIVDKSLYDAGFTDYQPYALSNPVITPALIKQVDDGAKNLVAWDIPTVRSLNTNATWTSDDTCVKGGITYKFNTDGTIVANGTADASGSKYIKLKSGFSVTKGLIASCWLPAVSQDQSKGLLQLDYLVGYGLNVYDYERSKEVDRDGTVELYITVLGGVTVSNLIFRPMICTAADWAVSQKFVPYAPTNRELYESDKVIDISNAITAGTGYTVESSTHLYYQNKQVFGTIAIAINSGSYPSSLTAIAKLPVEYAPARQYLVSCGFSTDQWAITNIGYAFIQGANASSTAQRGQISVKSPTANLTHMILNVCYPVQIDEVLAVT